jgi:hypothetical protein
MPLTFGDLMPKTESLGVRVFAEISITPMNHGGTPARHRDHGRETEPRWSRE